MMGDRLGSGFADTLSGLESGLAGARSESEVPAGLLTMEALEFMLAMTSEAIQRAAGEKYIQAAIREGRPGWAQLAAETQAFLGMTHGMELLVSVASTSRGRDAIERAAAAWPQDDTPTEGGADD